MLRALVASFLLYTAMFAFGGAAAAEGISATAADLIYDAADAIDAARLAAGEGNTADRDRFLTKAEDYLEQAERIAPGYSRIRYERARLHQVDGDAKTAHETLLGLMREDLPTVELVETAELLDAVRSDLELAPVGSLWSRTTTIRNIGLISLGGGVAVALAGLAVAFGTYAQDTADGLERTTQNAQRAGFILTGVGGGLAVGGGAVTLGAQVRLGDMRAWLPGPWRMVGVERPMGFHLAVTVTPPAPRR